MWFLLIKCLLHFEFILEWNVIWESTIIFFNGLKNIYYFKFAFPYWHKELFYTFVCFIYLFLYVCFNISYDMVLVLFLPSQIMLAILKHLHFRMNGLISFLIFSFQNYLLLSMSSIFCLTSSPSLPPHSFILSFLLMNPVSLFYWCIHIINSWIIN